MKQNFNKYIIKSYLFNWVLSRVVNKNDCYLPHLGSIPISDMMTFFVIDSTHIFESKKSLKDWNMYIPHMKYKYISHGKKESNIYPNIEFVDVFIT